jgi:RNA polymerase sigma-70 factor (ECF subfamily)
VSDRKPRNSHRRSEISGAYLEHRTFLKRFLSRFLSSPEDIEDVVQETFLRAYNAESQGADIHSPKAFLFQIARTLAFKELGKRSRLIISYIEDLAATEIICEESSVEDRVAERERLAVFCKAAAGLPLQCRRAFLLRKVYGFSQKEISREMNISVSTVEKHLATGLIRCSAYMAAHGYAPARGRAVSNRKS